MIEKLKSFKEIEIEEENIKPETVIDVSVFHDFFTEELKEFLTKEEFEFEMSSSWLDNDFIPKWEEGDDLTWTRHCGTEDGSWYNYIFIRQNRIEACSEIECGGMFTNTNYWEYDSEESFQEAYNASVKWLNNIKKEKNG